MDKNVVLNAFEKLGEIMTSIGSRSLWPGLKIGITQLEYEDLQGLVKRQFYLNGWFTEDSVLQQFESIGVQLTFSSLNKFTESYTFAKEPKTIGVIMAGNIPLVGFHDFLCVLLTGNRISCKLSSDDKSLLPALASILIKFYPELDAHISFRDGKIGSIDAMIATGSGNSMLHFESYFGHLPHVFRKNRTSIAVITGKETKCELEALGSDVFSFFGLGCRNVSHLIIHKDVDINRFFEAIISYAHVVNLHKYANNYDYNKAIYLMNLEQILDNGFVLLKESEELFSPLAMVFYHRYQTEFELESYLNDRKDHIQAVVGHGYFPFGSAQSPKLSDFADGVDTLKWMSRLNMNA